MSTNYCWGEFNYDSDKDDNDKSEEEDNTEPALSTNKRNDINPETWEESRSKEPSESWTVWKHTLAITSFATEGNETV